MDQLEDLAKQALEGGSSTEQQALRDALRRVSDPALIRALAGRFYTDPEVSVPAFERLLELSPGNIDYRVDLGFVFFLIGEDDEARRQLRMAQSLDPEHVRVLTLEAALAREQTEKVRIYRRILQKEPGNEIALGNLKELGEAP
jgi:tetratricopeptide (TPR) repeat protein